MFGRHARRAPPRAKRQKTQPPDLFQRPRIVITDRTAGRGDDELAGFVRGRFHGSVALPGLGYAGALLESQAGSGKDFPAIFHARFTDGPRMEFHDDQPVTL